MTHEQQNRTLTALQKRFVREYPLDFNGQAAYMRAAGTTNKKSASVQASKFLKMPKIKEALEVYIEEQLGPQEKQLLSNVKFWEEVRDSRHDQVLVSLEEVLELVDDEDLRDKINSLPIKRVPANRTADRLKASENLAKFSQMFVDRSEIQHTATVQIVDDIK